MRPMVLACSAAHRHDPAPNGECWIPATVGDFNIEAAAENLAQTFDDFGLVTLSGLPLDRVRGVLVAALEES